jgi:hypothetical protein
MLRQACVFSIRRADGAAEFWAAGVQAEIKNPSGAERARRRLNRAQGEPRAGRAAWGGVALTRHAAVEFVIFSANVR